MSISSSTAKRTASASITTPAASSTRAYASSSKSPGTAGPRRPSCLGPLPVVQRAVLEPVHRKVGALVWVLGRERLIDVDTETGLVAGMQHAIAERISMREDGVGLFGMPHIFLDTEVRHRQIEVQRRRHRDRR